MRVNIWKLKWSTEELGIILTLEWCPRRVAVCGGVLVTLHMIKTHGEERAIVLTSIPLLFLIIFRRKDIIGHVSIGL